MKRFLVVASVCVFLSPPLTAATVTGKVTFLTKRGQRPVIAETLVWLDPAVKPAAKPAAKPDEKLAKKTAATFSMTTRGKTFQPHVMAVAAGSSVSFPNEDPISHNLFSLTPGQTFDLGLYRRGPGKRQKFETPGVVNVYCNIHPNMSAVVHVMTTPYFVFADATGGYRIDAPPGKYRLSAWNEQAGTTFTEIDIRPNGAVAGATALLLDGRTVRMLQHKNKHGKPYRSAREY